MNPRDSIRLYKTNNYSNFNYALKMINGKEMVCKVSDGNLPSGQPTLNFSNGKNTEKCPMKYSYSLKHKNHCFVKYGNGCYSNKIIKEHITITEDILPNELKQYRTNKKYTELKPINESYQLKLNFIQKTLK